MAKDDARTQNALEKRKAKLDKILRRPITGFTFVDKKGDASAHDCRGELLIALSPGIASSTMDDQTKPFELAATVRIERRVRLGFDFTVYRYLEGDDNASVRIVCERAISPPVKISPPKVV